LLNGKYQPEMYVEREARLFNDVCLVCGKYLSDGEKYVNLLCKGFLVTTLCYSCWQQERIFYPNLKQLKIGKEYV